MTVKAVNDKRGIVIKPKYSMYLVVQDIPNLHVSIDAGRIL